MDFVFSDSSSSEEETVTVPVEKEELNLSVYVLKEKILKLCNLSEKLDVTTFQKAEACNLKNLSWLFEKKCEIIANIRNLLEEFDEISTTEGELLVQLYALIVQENKESREIIDFMQREMEDLDELKAQQDNFVQAIAKNEELLDITNNMQAVTLGIDLGLLDKNSKKKLKETKENLHYLLDKYFDNPKTKELVKDLTNAFFKGGDEKYITLTDTTPHSMSDVNMLKEAGLIVEDPYDNTRIKFDDFI